MKIFTAFLFVLVLSAQAIAQTSQLPVMIGDVKGFTKTTNGISVTLTNARADISVYSPTTIRVRISGAPLGPDQSYAVVAAATGTFTRVRDHRDSLMLETDSLRVVIQKKPFRVKFCKPDGTILLEDYPAFGTSWLGTEVTSYKKLFPDEKFIGLGEKTGPLNRRGNAYQNWNTDIPSYSEHQDPLYQSIPFYMGIHGQVVYGIFLDNSYRTRFNFGASTDDAFSFFSAANGDLNYYFFGASTVAGIIQDYTSLTGRMPLPPYWSLGYQQCRWGYYPESEVMSLAQKFRDKKIPCDVIYLDIDYMDSYKIFTWNSTRFPDPKKMIGTLNKAGFHIVTIVDPGIKVEKGYKAYEEGLRDGCFIKYPDGTIYTGSVWPGRCHFPDFTLEEARQWWGKNFTALTDPGVEGFWNDMNEPATWGQNIPDIVELNFDGLKGTLAKGHNIYGLEMSRATYEGTRKLLGGKRPFVLTRAGFSGIQRYSAVWTGDNTSTEKDILMGVRLVNSMGLSGISFTGADIGGFVGSPTKEMFVRWLSVGIYTPFLRNHTEVNSRDQEPWAFGEDFEALSRTLIEYRYKLLPYIYSTFYESTLTGMPVARSLAIGYTFDNSIYDWNYQNQYMFGKFMLVAPLTSDQQFARVYLPKGNWFQLSTGKRFTGPGEILTEAPLSELPVFISEGAMIPMQPVIQNTGEKPGDTLTLMVYQGNIASVFTYYEDDGVSFDYEKGSYLKRDFTLDPEKRRLIVGKAEGSWNSRYKKLKIVFQGGDKPEEHTIDFRNDKSEISYR